MGAISMCAADIKILTYYRLGDSLIPFSDNPWNNIVFYNAKVVVTQEKRSVGTHQFLVDIIKINDDITIECEVVGARKENGWFVIKICQDWG